MITFRERSTWRISYHFDSNRSRHSSRIRATIHII